MWLLAQRGRIRNSTKRSFFSQRLLYNATDALPGLTTPARHAQYLFDGPPSPGEFMLLLHFTVLSPTFMPHLHRRKTLGKWTYASVWVPPSNLHGWFDKMIKGHCFRPQGTREPGKSHVFNINKKHEECFVAILWGSECFRSSVAVNFTMWLIKQAKK